MEFSNVPSLIDASIEQTKSLSSVVHEEKLHISRDIQESCPPTVIQMDEANVGREWVVSGPVGNQYEFAMSKSGYDGDSPSTPSNIHARDCGIGDTSQLLQDSSYIGIHLLLISFSFVY